DVAGECDQGDAVEIDAAPCPSQGNGAGAGPEPGESQKCPGEPADGVSSASAPQLAVAAKLVLADAEALALDAPVDVLQLAAVQGLDLRAQPGRLRMQPLEHLPDAGGIFGEVDVFGDAGGAAGGFAPHSAINAA